LSNILKTRLNKLCNVNEKANYYKHLFHNTIYRVLLVLSVEIEIYQQQTTYSTDKFSRVRNSTTRLIYLRGENKNDRADH